MRGIKIVALATTLALGLGTFALAGCGQQGGTTGTSGTVQDEAPQYADEAFIASLSKGLEARWKLGEELTYETTEEEEMVFRQLVNAELDELKDYTDASFEDSKLQEKAIQYINLLKDQLEALKYIQVDYVKYNEMWQEAFNARSKMLVDFVDNYGLTVSNEWAETLNDMKVNATEVADKENRQAKVEALGDGVVFEKASDDEWDYKYTAVVENNTGFDINTYDANVILFDADGVNVGTGYIYVNSWKNGQKAKFEIWSDQPFTSTEIVVSYWD